MSKAGRLAAAGIIIIALAGCGTLAGCGRNSANSENGTGQGTDSVNEGTQSESQQTSPDTSASGSNGNGNNNSGNGNGNNNNGNNNSANSNNGNNSNNSNNGTNGNNSGTNGSSGNNEETTSTAPDGWSDEMETLRSAVANTLGENYWPNAMIDTDMLEGIYGISPDMYEDYLGEMPSISVNVDTLLVIKAADNTADEVEEVLTEYREGIIQNSTQYPMNLGKIQASRIERMGDYVFFVQLGGDTMSAADISDEEVIRHCQEQNELAIAVLEKHLVR